MAKTKKDGDMLINKLEKSLYKDFRELPQEVKCLAAVGYIGGKTKLVNTEDVAIQLWKWLPEDYGWVKYKKYPDKQMPKRGLTSIRTYEWVVGGMSQKITEDGYQLTPVGIDIYKKVESIIPGTEGSKVSRKEVMFLNNKIGNSKLYKDYEITKDRGQNINISEFDICDLLESIPGMAEQTRKNFYHYLTLSIKNEKKDFIEFLNFIKEKQPDLLSQSTYHSDSRNRKKL